MVEAMNKKPWLIDCEIGNLILPGLLGIIMMGPIGLGNRFQPTNVFHEMGKRGIFNGSTGEQKLVKSGEIPVKSGENLWTGIYGL